MERLKIENIRRYVIGICNVCSHVTQAPERIGTQCTQTRLDGKRCPGVYIKQERVGEQ